MSDIDKNLCRSESLGEELLRTVVERGRRAKIARMARSKLALARHDEG
jgi:hypothetical protein